MKTAMAIVVFGALFFAGCSPEELELAIKTSAISKAASGAYGMATATISFEVETDDIKSKLPKIRSAVMPYLGKDGKITVRGDKITAKFKVPVVASSYCGNFPEKSLARLVLKDGLLKFEPTSRLDALNRALSNIDFSLDVDFKAKHVVFKIIGDSDSKCRVSATAVFIDGEAKVNYIADVGNDDSVDIEFRCDNEASVYHQIQPFIGIEPEEAFKPLANAKIDREGLADRSKKPKFANDITHGSLEESRSFFLNGFYLGMPIMDAKKLVENYLPDAKVVITKDNNLEIDPKPKEEFLDTGITVDPQEMYFCQADKLGKVYRFNFDKRFLRKWFDYDVQDWHEWAREYGKQFNCDFRSYAVKKEASNDRFLIYMRYSQPAYRYRNNRKKYIVSYYGKLNTDGFVPVDESDLFAGGERSQRAGFALGAHKKLQEYFENGDGAKEGTLRVEVMRD